MKIINCLQCNKEINIYPYQEGKVKFCSHKCLSDNKREKWISIDCKECGKTFTVPLHRKNTAKYCSLSCGCKNHLAGYWKNKKRHSMIGKKNWEWKDKKVGYRALHRWVERWLGKPCKCEFCGKEKTTAKSIHWANKSRRYIRSLEDWLSLCVKCHKQYDKGGIL